MSKRSDQKPNDQRVKAIGSVWAAAIALLALSIPLSAILRSALIPIVVIFGVAVVTVYLWKSGEKPGDAEASENEALRAKIQELEERLANVEVINRFEDRLAEKQLRQSQEKAAADDTAPSPAKLKG